MAKHDLVGHLPYLANRFSQRLLEVFVRDLPLDLRPWGEAMLAELPMVKGVVAPVIWALGGSCFLSKALLARWISGQPVRGSNGSHPSSPLERGALVAAVLSLAMLLSPVFRQGLAASLESWNPRFEPRIPNLQQIIRDAEKENDAPTLAFAAMETRDWPTAQRLATRAGALDPQLTWVWLPILQRTLPVSGVPANGVDRFEQERIAQLEKWDPENSVPYLLEAHRIRMAQGAQWPEAHSWKLAERNVDYVQRQSEWRKAMEKAFAAPRYDTYFDRSARLASQVYRRLGNARPLGLVEALNRYPWPSLEEVKLYSDLLLMEGDRADAGGQTDRAIALFQVAVQFDQLMNKQANSGFERMYASRLQADAYKKFAALYDRQHRDGEARKMALAEAALRNARPDFRNSRQFWEFIYGPVALTGNLVAISSVLAMLALFMTLAGTGYYFTRQWTRPAAPRWLDTALIWAGRFSPPVLLASCLTLYFSYWPYAELFRGYLDGSLPASEQIQSFWHIRYLPSQVIWSLGGPEGIRTVFWSAVTILLLIVAVVILYRGWSSRRKAEAPAG